MDGFVDGFGLTQVQHGGLGGGEQLWFGDDDFVSKTFSAAELSGLISGVGNIATLKPERTTQTGRIITMRAIGDAGERVISGDDLRYFLDLRSSRFSVQTNNGNFVINGFGFGHGVGMSQWGAYNLARRGANYQQILLYYYQNANLAIIQVD